MIGVPAVVVASTADGQPGPKVAYISTPGPESKVFTDTNGIAASQQFGEVYVPNPSSGVVELLRIS